MGADIFVPWIFCFFPLSSALPLAPRALPFWHARCLHRASPSTLRLEIHMKRLDHLIQSIQNMDDGPAMGLADLLLYAPCPVKLVVKERIEAIAASFDPPLVTHIPMGCTSVDPYDPLYMETDPARLPAVVASIGFGDFWRRGFVDRFVRSGLFCSVLPGVGR